MIYSPTGSSNVFDSRLHDLSSQISHPPPPSAPLRCVWNKWVLAGTSLRSKRFHLVSKQRRTEERDSQFWPREKWNKRQKMKVGGGEGKEGNAYRQTPRFWKPAFASERSAWLAPLVEQCWHVSIKGLFHTERTVWYVSRILIFSGCCLFWSARFVLQCKNIFFDLFWNVRLFLRLNKGFRSFNLI